ncbi:XRE family transcriptional regulator [Mycobacterium sp. Aquia_216]|uniref:helix-turn-helix domain-containing protein n=1 Tax=Mycobacterium sp. Aquia_216 TaxID=2991729 RepID=UPI00227C742E|nr:XRE family transcriptional regulator [Mycobacterium sp. Aquia_216]WAJ42837.1 XRE family transcriptional regulator [Mycobacterium sp. Aquia_216]
METELIPELGQRLREMRKLRGRSVREQARILKVSPSTLSELERGIAGISLQRLQAVAQSLGVSMADLLTPNGASSASGHPLEIITPADLGSATVHPGPGLHYALVGSGGQHRLQPYRVTFDAGASAPEPIRHAGQEFCYVLFGEVYLHLGDNQYLVTAGSFARFDSDIPHAFSNASQTNVAGFVGAGTPAW